ncbi:MAG: MBL fold metallo-hydrolase [Acidobacteria bacterium]|nr:MAG: MBL fold metallo-hydrolase [Acidobacteriota bacterium]
MGVCVSVLASGSRGNSALLESSRARILVDAGVSCRETFKRLKLVGREPRSLSAILITHEHSDHVSGLAMLAKKLGIPVFMTGGTHQAWARSLRDDAGQLPTLAKLEIFSAGRQFQIADITVMPFTIPHDAADPVGFTFHAEGAKIAFATDLGYMPASVRDHLRRCDVLILESNHDVEMLRVGPYPWSVKQRVMSRVGHLSNDSLAQFFAEDYDGGASHIVLAHLSEQNNHPEVARRTAEQALGPQQTLLQNRLMLALQDAPTEAIRL